MEIIIHHGVLFGPFQVRSLCSDISTIFNRKDHSSLNSGIMLLFGGIFYAIFAEGTVQPWAEEKSNEDSDEKTTLKS